MLCDNAGTSLGARGQREGLLGHSDSCCRLKRDKIGDNQIGEARYRAVVGNVG